MLVPLVVAAVCLAPATAQTILENNRTAVAAPLTGGATVTARYDYRGQGLQGQTDLTYDSLSGRFLTTTAIGSILDTQGFDGALAWMKDLSGASIPEASRGESARAISQAYRYANAWWRPGFGGAHIEMIGCGGLKVTPPGGNPFEAWFDPTTHQVARIRERQPFGMMAETRFSDYQRRADRMVAGRVEVISDDDASDVEVRTLKDLTTTAPRPASAYARPANAFSDVSLPASAQVTLPFQLLNNHIIVDVRVNGRGPFPFLIDSGGHDIITPSTVQAIAVESKGETRSGGSGDQTATSGYAHIDSLDAGGAVLRDQTVATLEFSPLNVEGLQLGGMLGLEFLERFVVQFDYGARTVTILSPARFRSARLSAAGVKVPFSFYEHMPQVQGTFDGRPALFNIDTGSRADITITQPFVASAELKEAYAGGVVVTEGWGVGGPTRPYVVRAGLVKIGPVEVARPIAGLSASVHGAFSDSNYDGNVGSGILKRFTLTLDYAQQALYLKPTTRLDADTGQLDRAGMWLNLDPAGITIVDVTAAGPAEAAGLKVGDVITSIAGTALSGRSLSDVRSSLKTLPVDQAIKIDYARSGQAASTMLTPRELVP